MTSFSITVKQHLAAACERAWGAYVWSLQLIIYALLAYAVSKAGTAYFQMLQAPQQVSTAFSHPHPLSRGVARPVFCVLVLPPFHPNARPIVVGGPPTPSMTRWFLDRCVPLLAETVVSALSKLTDLVRPMKRTYQLCTGTINAAVTPLSTRLNRGIVQLSALPNVPIHQAALRHLRPLLLLVGVFIGLIAFTGPSLKWAMALGFCSLVLVVLGGARGVGDQGVPAPGMANAGLIGALEARAGARSGA